MINPEFDPDWRNREFTERDELLESTLLRREAGEGWADDGLNEHLLARIVDREEIIETMREWGVRPPQKPFDPNDIPEQGQVLYNAYLNISGDVERIKEESGIGDPPPLPQVEN